MECGFEEEYTKGWVPLEWWNFLLSCKFWVI